MQSYFKKLVCESQLSASLLRSLQLASIQTRQYSEGTRTVSKIQSRKPTKFDSILARKWHNPPDWVPWKVWIILLKDTATMGSSGAVLQVSTDKMREELFPQQVAAYATPENLMKYRQLRMELWARENVGFGRSDALMQLPLVLNKLSEIGVTLRRYPFDEHSCEQGITAWDIIWATRKQLWIDIPEKSLQLRKPINEFGQYHVPLQIASLDYVPYVKMDLLPKYDKEEATDMPEVKVKQSLLAQTIQGKRKAQKRDINARKQILQDKLDLIAAANKYKPPEW